MPMKYNTPVKVKAVVDFFGPTDMVAMANDAPANQPAYMLLMGGTPGTQPDHVPAIGVRSVILNAAHSIIIQGRIGSGGERH